jgi:Tfp pilus assembly protein PilN
VPSAHDVVSDVWVQLGAAVDPASPLVVFIQIFFGTTLGLALAAGVQVHRTRSESKHSERVDQDALFDRSDAIMDRLEAERMQLKGENDDLRARLGRSWDAEQRLRRQVSQLGGDPDA